MRPLWDNPLVRLESRRRFRGLRAALGLPLALLLPSLVVTLVYVGQVRSSDNSFQFQPVFPGGVPDGVPEGLFDVEAPPAGFGARFDSTFFVNQDIGQGLFLGCFVTLAMVALLFVPSMVGPSIVSERSDLTLQAMQLTRLTPDEIAGGKLTSALMYLAWLGAGSIPLVAIAYALGGVSPGAILVAYLVLGLFVLEIAAVSLAFSARTRRVGAATIGAILGSVGLCVVPIVSAAVIGFALSLLDAAANVGFKPPEWLVYVGTPSPISTTSLLPMVDLPHRTGVRLASVAWSVVIIVVALRSARRGVTAPVELDR